MQVAKWYITLDYHNADNWEDTEDKLQKLENILQAVAESLGFEISGFEQK